MTNQELLPAIMKANGWADQKTMFADPRVKKLVAAEKQAAVKQAREPDFANVLAKLSVVVTPNCTEPGHFIGTREFTYKDKTSGQRLVSGVGPMVLLQNGEVMSFKNGQELNLAAMSPVMVEGLTITQNIIDQTVTIGGKGDGVKVRPEAHAHQPRVGYGAEILAECEKLITKTSKNGTKRTIMAGRSFGKALIMGTIGVERDDVKYDRAGEQPWIKEDELKARVYCPNGDGEPVVWSMKLPIEQVREDFGIHSAAADQDDFRNRLKGARVIAYGPGGTTIPKSMRKKPGSDESGFGDTTIAEIQDEMNKLGEQGQLVIIGEQDGEPLRALNLAGLKTLLPDGKLVDAMYVNIGSNRIFDAVEAAPGEWEFAVLATDNKNGANWFSVVQKQKADGSLTNEGSFVIFPDVSGAMPRAADDPLKLAAGQLTINVFDDTEG